MKRMLGSSSACSSTSSSGGSDNAPMSVKDRMKMFNNNHKIECDPTAFAIKLNKEEKGE
jgi:hypothetical protein